MSQPAADRWRAELAAWRVDDAILAAAPESPYGFPPALFAPPDMPTDTPSRQAALDALPVGGSVLDVGCGGGVAGLALVPPAATLTGVDESPDMLAVLASSAAHRGVELHTVRGSWPAVAADVPVHDVVVCHHVLYNIPELPAFAAALTAHARHRVVCEISGVHPWATLAGLWRHFHHQPRPAGPSADLAADVLGDSGCTVHVERFDRPPHFRAASEGERVAFTRRRLCLPYAREPEVRAMLAGTDPAPPTEVATLWWDVPSTS